MSDDNIVELGKARDEAKSEKAGSIEERVLQCMSNDECACMYCNYKKTAATMMVDILARDIYQFENNTGGSMCTFDMKVIFFNAINEIKKMEKDQS